MDVCCECCMLSGRGLCEGPITRPEESYGVSECDCKDPHKTMTKNQIESPQVTKRVLNYINTTNVQKYKSRSAGSVATDTNIKVFCHTCCRVKPAGTACSEICENLHQSCDTILLSYWPNQSLQQLIALMTH